MNEWKKNNKEEREIDLWRFVEVLIKRAWLIALAVVIFAMCGFGYTKLFITPMYKTQFQAYITNKTGELGQPEENTEQKTNTGDLNASIGLMYLYNEIICSRSVLTAAAEDVGLHGYKYGTLKGMVTTEMPEKASMIKVTVSATNPDTAKKLAEAIASRAIERGQEIEKRSTMIVVDEPVRPENPYSPNTASNVLVAAVVGGVLAYAIFVIIDLVNDRVKSSEDLENRYDVVVVGQIPDMSTVGREYRYRYKYSYRRYNYGKGYGEQK